MASGSSRGYVSRYDVFLSYGGDTRHVFTDHLYDKLLRAGVYTFRDSDAISRGEDLTPAIESGIRESRASIVVLSELKQDGPFKIEVTTNTKWTEENAGRWKAALEKVGNMTGEVAYGPETGFLQKIADIIMEKLNLKQIYRQANLVGMETRDKEINYWLEESDNEILAICGMEGGGKTTLARHIAYSNWHKFDNVSILEDIGSRSNEGLRHLQEKLIGYIIEGKEKTNPSVWQGTYTIENALQRKKALIVLDNIVTKKQLDALIGTGTITQSKIIITTTEKGSSKWFKSPWRCQEYEMKLLDEGESLKLLKLHAFEPNVPMEGYEELEKRALRYCEGNPLALEVWGSCLNCDNSYSSNSRKQFWESMMTSLERQVTGQIQSVLITSYNALQLNSVKELFLHIACFFNGKDKDYVQNILEPDYYATSGIVTLTNSCLLSVSPNNELMMHRLLQEMGRTIVLAESPKRPGKRSRIWRNDESLDVLSKNNGSAKVEGLALDMKMLSQEHMQGEQELSELDTDSFKKMNNLKLLQLNQLELTGSYTNISKDLRWLFWRECRLITIPSALDMGKLVAIDMSYSKLEVFEPPKVLPSLKILNLKHSDNLVTIKNISRLHKLETLNLRNCCRLVHVHDTLGELTSLKLLNLTGCENLCEGWDSSLSDGNNINQPHFQLPNSLKQLFLMDCNRRGANYPLSFNHQLQLEYLNLAVNPFELLPSYTHLNSLRVLDLSGCRALKKLLHLPRKLAELYVFYCDSLESVTFESCKYTLQEFRYEGCVNLSEVEDYFKFVPVAMLTDADLGHMNWLRAYQDLEVCMVGDDDLTKGRSLRIQMLYEFDIMSISLPDIERPNMIPDYEYTSEIPFFCFTVPPCPSYRTIKGLNISFKYKIEGDEWVWFAKISTTNGFELIYNAKVFGKPASDEVGIWLGYWSIGQSLHVGDEVNVSIVVTKGLEIFGCGASLVYTDEEEESESFIDSEESFEDAHEYFEDTDEFFDDSDESFEDSEASFEDDYESSKDNNETSEGKNRCPDILGEVHSRFELSTGTYYLCRRDYSQLMEVGRLTPNWFRDLVGDTIDYAEIGGWRKTGRPDQLYRSYTELKRTGCLYGP